MFVKSGKKSNTVKFTKIFNKHNLVSSALIFMTYTKIVFFVILSGKDFKLMKMAEKRVTETGKVLNEGSNPMVSSDITSIKKIEKNGIFI